MPGKSGPKAENDRLRDRIDTLNKELSAARRLLASVNPQLLDKLDGNRPAPIGDVTSANVDKVGRKIEAMAGEGMTYEEWIAALGLTQNQWDQAVARFPTMAEAVARARARFRAFLTGSMKRAIDNRDNRFPVHVFKQLLATLEEQEIGGSLGDASQLVHVDLSPSPCSLCPIASEAMDANGEKPQKSADPEASA